ncbi:MAG: hypothetical protein FWE50_03540 [Alphaproteobacteria bacterium]|nr:hypothetical protein [Alphaproteobacteria bacterium]
MITIADVIKTIKNNYDYTPVQYRVMFGDVTTGHPIDDMGFGYAESQDIGMLLSFAKYHKLSHLLTHSLFCENHNNVPSVFQDTFDKKRFLEKLKIPADKVAPLWITYEVHQCKLDDPTGIKPFIFPNKEISPCDMADIVKYRISGTAEIEKIKEESGYKKCKKCEYIQLPHDIPTKEIIHPKSYQDTSTETLSMLSAVGIQYLGKVKALGHQYG